MFRTAFLVILKAITNSSGLVELNEMSDITCNFLYQAKGAVRQIKDQIGLFFLNILTINILFGS